MILSYLKYHRVLKFCTVLAGTSTRTAVVVSLWYRTKFSSFGSKAVFKPVVWPKSSTKIVAWSPKILDVMWSKRIFLDHAYLLNMLDALYA